MTEGAVAILRHAPCPVLAGAAGVVAGIVQVAKAAHALAAAKAVMPAADWAGMRAGESAVCGVLAFHDMKIIERLGRKAMGIGRQQSVAFAMAAVTAS